MEGGVGGEQGRGGLHWWKESRRQGVRVKTKRLAHGRQMLGAMECVPRCAGRGSVTCVRGVGSVLPSTKQWPFWPSCTVDRLEASVPRGKARDRRTGCKWFWVTASSCWLLLLLRSLRSSPWSVWALWSGWPSVATAGRGGSYKPGVVSLLRGSWLKNLSGPYLFFSSLNGLKVTIFSTTNVLELHIFN